MDLEGLGSRAQGRFGSGSRQNRRKEVMVEDPKAFYSGKGGAVQGTLK